MIIGIPKEILDNENRVALTPVGVEAFLKQGHEVRVEKNAGEGSGFTDDAYEAAGAILSDGPAFVWQADMVMKVKEPKPSEYHYFRENLILFTYLHLAPATELTQALIDAKITAIAYETIQLEDRSLPLLIPMSEIAGRMSVQIGAQLLEKSKGGKGILLAGIPGVKKGNVVIIGGGNVGTNAAKIAIGLGANVTILDVNQKRLAELDALFGNEIQTLISNAHNIAETVKTADVVIGTVLIPGAKAPTLVTEEMVASMGEGSVIVDVAVDQGGIFETIDHVTSHSNPTYVRHGVIHYAVPNMPGNVARTSTIALTNATLPYAMQMATHDLNDVLRQTPSLQKGVNIYQGVLTNEQIAAAQNRKFQQLAKLIGE